MSLGTSLFMVAEGTYISIQIRNLEDKKRQFMKKNIEINMYCSLAIGGLSFTCCPYSSHLPLIISR